MPFKSPEQEAWMWINKPEMAKKWYKEHGHSKGWKAYQKNKRKSKRKKRSELVKKFLHQQGED